MENFLSSGLHSKQAHVKIPEGLFEEEHGRKGFFGRVSHLYHSIPPVNWTEIEGDLKPRCLKPIFEESSHQDFLPLLYNSDLLS